MIDIALDGQKSVDRANSLLRGINGGAIKATYQAIKRASETAKTQAGRFASAEYEITKSTFMNNVNIKTHIVGGHDGVATASVVFSGHVLKLTSFSLSVGSQQSGGNIQVKVLRNGSVTPLSRAFAANIFGRLGVFERKGPERFPLREDYGPSTAHMMENDEVRSQMHEKVNAVFEERMEHEILRVLNGWGGR